MSPGFEALAAGLAICARAIQSDEGQSGQASVSSERAPCAETHSVSSNAKQGLARRRFALWGPAARQARGRVRRGPVLRVEVPTRLHRVHCGCMGGWVVGEWVGGE